jgi:polyribonucleotide nucleotidyltransferase
MDVKVDGVPVSVLAEALEKAKAARLHILDVMDSAIASPRAHISPRAPEILSLIINPDQIGLVIGSGGKTVNGIKDETGVDDITIEDDGTIYITGKNGTAASAKKRIEDLTKIYALGERATAVVTKLADFGAFVKLPNGSEGLVHISEIVPFRVEKVGDVLALGETIETVVVKIENGKIGLSLKQADPEFAKRKGIEPKV